MTKLMVKEAPIIWNALKSIICVYKPPNVTCERVRKKIIHAVVTELNEMEVRPPIDYVSIEGDPSQKLTVVRHPNLADHPLVVGPRYQHQDMMCSWSNYLGYNTSGVLLMGLRDGTKIAKYIRENHPMRTYRISGKLGEATESGFLDEKVIERSTWRHVKNGHMEHLLATMQTSHQKEMFKLCGIDIQSQAAYDLASQGPIRPANSKIPVLYGIKCVKFEPPESPHFVLEVQCINEYETYLKGLIHEIGIKLHSTAHCTQIQCIRHSYFNLDNALLKKHWTLNHIVDNMAECDRILKENESLVKQKHALLYSH